MSLFHDSAGEMLVSKSARGELIEPSNLVMTPHMSGWTNGTVRRRQETVAENIRRLRRGLSLLNTIRR